MRSGLSPAAGVGDWSLEPPWRAAVGGPSPKIGRRQIGGGRQGGRPAELKLPPEDRGKSSQGQPQSHCVDEIQLPPAAAIRRNTHRLGLLG
ncbi:hypothetical protein GCM10009841_10860 [Microlunatus panaciterrae]